MKNKELTYYIEVAFWGFALGVIIMCLIIFGNNMNYQ